MILYLENTLDVNNFQYWAIIKEDFDDLLLISQKTEDDKYLININNIPFIMKPIDY